MPRPSVVLPVLIAGLLACGAAAQESPRYMACTALAECVAQVRDPRIALRQLGSDPEEPIVAFGEAAVDALVLLLADSDPDIRYRAAYLLARFPTIDPRHLPALKQAWQPADGSKGQVWAARALAATGTDEAVALLWPDFLGRPDPQVVFAVAGIDEARIRPLALARFAECRDTTARIECNSLFHLLKAFGQTPPPWIVDAFADLAQNARRERLRQDALEEMVRLGHPAAREPVQQRLAALPPEGEPPNGWRARQLIRDVVRYGAESRESGPDIVPYLDPRFDPDVRAQAALALGAIDARSAIPALVALAGAFEDDWVLAYNTVESLGRLRATEARDLVRRTAETHWHRGVRNNAQRALSAIDGGAFAGPGMSEEGSPYPGSPGDPDRQPFYAGPLRWIGDDAARYCDMPEQQQQVAAEVSGSLQFPAAGSVVLRFEPPSPASQAAVRERISPNEAPGRVVAIRRLPAGELIAFAAGEFGGGVFHRPDDGTTQVLMREPVSTMWQMGGRIYVTAGLTHMMSNYGHLYVIDPAVPRIERIVRLPASPGTLVALAEGVVVIRTSDGDVGLREDGTLLDPSMLERCAGDS